MYVFIDFDKNTANIQVKFLKNKEVDFFGLQLGHMSYLLVAVQDLSFAHAPWKLLTLFFKCGYGAGVLLGMFEEGEQLLGYVGLPLGWDILCYVCLHNT